MMGILDVKVNNYSTEIPLQSLPVKDKKPLSIS